MNTNAVSSITKHTIPHRIVVAAQPSVRQATKQRYPATAPQNNAIHTVQRPITCHLLIRPSDGPKPGHTDTRKAKSTRRGPAAQTGA